MEAEAEENDESANAIPKKSLQEYLAELELSKQELEGSKKLRQANEGAEQNGPPKKDRKATRSFLLLLTRKLNPRPKKEKVFLDIDANFGDEQPQTTRGGFRGGKRWCQRWFKRWR